MPVRKSMWRIRSFYLACMLLSILTAGCSVQAPPLETMLPPTGTVSLQVENTRAPATPAEASAQKTIRNTPTPAPTATPGPLTLAINQISRSTGADRIYVFGITLGDWLNTLVSFLIFLLVVLLALGVLHWILLRVVTLTRAETDNLLMELAWPQVRWLGGILALSYGTSRLTYLSPSVKQTLDQVYWSLVIVTLGVVAWKLVSFVVVRYKEKVEPDHPGHQEDHVVVLVQRAIRLSIVVVTIVVILDIFNVNVDALIAALGVGGLAISLAAKDSLSNMISGLILLLDKPFRVGDRIEVGGAGTWGDVVDIGLRSTLIRTGDNRMVIIPNSVISTDRVINYSYQDPILRLEIEFAVGYDADLDTVRKLVIDTVQQVEGILPDKPVDVLYLRMGDTGRILRIRWWIASYRDKWHVIDQVTTSVQNALNSAGILIPSNISFRTVPK